MSRSRPSSRLESLPAQGNAGGIVFTCKQAYQEACQQEVNVYSSHESGIKFIVYKLNPFLSGKE